MTRESPVLSLASEGRVHKLFCRMMSYLQQRQLERRLDGTDGPALVLEKQLKILETLSMISAEVGGALHLQRFLKRVRVAAAKLVAELDQLVDDVHLHGQKSAMKFKFYSLADI